MKCAHFHFPMIMNIFLHWSLFQEGKTKVFFFIEFITKGTAKGSHIYSYCSQFCFQVSTLSSIQRIARHMRVFQSCHHVCSERSSPSTNSFTNRLHSVCQQHKHYDIQIQFNPIPHWSCQHWKLIGISHGGQQNPLVIRSNQKVSTHDFPFHNSLKRSFVSNSRCLRPSVFL